MKIEFSALILISKLVSLIWFYEDGSGGWNRFDNKLVLSDHTFNGHGVPSLAASVPEAIAELVNLCRAEGLEIDVPPTKALSFTSQVKQLEDCGLFTLTLPALPRARVTRPAMGAPTRTPAPPPRASFGAVSNRTPPGPPSCPLTSQPVEQGAHDLDLSDISGQEAELAAQTAAFRAQVVLHFFCKNIQTLNLG